MSIEQRTGDINVINEGRVKPLKDSDDLTIKAPLRDLVIKKLVNKLEEMGEGNRTRDIWLQGNSLRADWLNKQEVMLSTFDEFVEPIYDATNDWSSTLHLPVVYTHCKTMHARFLAALLGIDPPFTVKGRTSANVDRAFNIQEFMRYSLMVWANKYKGIDEVADRWIWRWITSGRGVLKNRWERAFTRYVDVVEKQETTSTSYMTGIDGSPIAIPQSRTIEEEKEVVIETANCPMVEFVPTEDILFVGSQDPQEADHVLHSVYYTASELWQLADQGIFRKEAVEKIIKSGESYMGTDATATYKQNQSVSSGSGQLDVDIDAQRYQVIERHSRIDVDGSGIASDIIMWCHAETGEICRATYLYRVNKIGLRPFFVADFYLRDNGMPAGLPELMYSIAKELDAMNNMKIDFGLISSMPFGFYRATSSMAEEKMPLEPGALIPLDNPQADVYFPQLGARHAFAAQEEQSLHNQLERMTAISDLSLGIVGGQGAARTATGARALLGESNANLDVYLKRLNRGWKAMLQHFFTMLQERTPEGFQYRITGEDGQQYWSQIHSREELKGMWDFEIDGNSANSNRQVTIEQASTILQTIMNPLLMQMGLINQSHLYAGIKNLFIQMGIKDYSKYITKPAGGGRIYTPEEIANSILAGVDIKLDPTQDLQGFLDYFTHIVDHDELLGQFNEGQTLLLAKKAQEAQQLMAALKQQAAQQANAQQMAMNAGMASSPSPQAIGTAQGQQQASGGQQ